MTEAAIGYGSKFELETAPGAGTYFRIAEITNLTPPQEKTDSLEATNFDSPDGYKEYITGMTDPGDVKFDMNFLPGSASETAILTAKASRVKYGARTTFPNGSVWNFSILILEYSPAVPVDKKMDASVSGKVTGAILRA